MSIVFLNSNKLKSGFGNDIINSSSYEDTLNQAGLNWTVSMQDAYADVNGKKILIPGQKVIVRNEDETPLGIVSDKYKPVNNIDALRIMDSIIETGEVIPLRGGTFANGKKVWIETKINKDYNIFGDDMDCYLVFMNSHDGTGSIKCLIVPERKACFNIMNFPISRKRSWRCIHTGNPQERIDEAKQILLAGSKYMEMIESTSEMLRNIKIPYEKVNDLVERLFPIDINEMSLKQQENIALKRSQLLEVFYNKDDLQNFDSNGYKFMSAVADYANHVNGKKTKNASLNRWISTIQGNPLVDNAFNIIISL